LCFLLFFIIVKYLGINTYYIASFQSQLIKFVMLGTSSMTLEASLFVFISSFMRLLVALISLTAGFALLSSYGFIKNNRKVGAIAALVSSFPMLILFNFSLVSIFLLLAMIISCTIIIPLANTYGMELKRWVVFRSGSHSISVALLILNILLGMGIFSTVAINADYYNNAVKNDLSATMEEMSMAEISGLAGITESQKELLMGQIKQRTDEFFSNSLLMRSLVKFLPLLTALTAWASLEMLRMLVLPNIGGVITYFLIRIRRRR
jgi:hypothetical protein